MPPGAFQRWPIKPDAMSSVPASQLAPETKDELLCTYAMLILHDDGAEISPASINNLIKGAGCTVEAYWPALFAKMAGNIGMEALIKMGGGGGAAVAAAPAAGGGGGGGGGDAGGKEEKKAV